mgnify:CR=1 FL=1
MNKRRFEVVELPDGKRDLRKVAEKLKEISDLKQVIYIEYTVLDAKTVGYKELYPGFKWPIIEETWGWQILIEREVERE